MSWFRSNALKCTLCQASVRAEMHPDADELKICCPLCGTYDIEGPARRAFESPTVWVEHDQRYLLSAMARTAPIRGVGRLRITMEILGRASRGEFRDKPFKERTSSILDWMEHESRTGSRSPYGAPVPLHPLTHYPIGWCRDERASRNWAEWEFVFSPLQRDGLIEAHNTDVYKITAKGWEYLEKRPKATGDRGFIAMAFKDMDHVHAAIADAVTAAGYKPLRIDGHEYVGGVMDEILARIRESRFVIADLTYNRGGVYYEAGFALALNIPVIPTCRVDHLKGDKDAGVEPIHFDMQHLNLILWEPSKLDELTKRLTNRIEAVLGPPPSQ